MLRFLASLFILISLSPVALLANTNEQSMIIDKIVQQQTQWKKNLATSRTSSDSLISPRIVGGSTTPRGKHPEFALVLFTNAFGDIINFCGGTLISSDKVLTAAHCTYNYSSNRTFVIPNFYSFNDNVVDSDIFSVMQKNRHPNYLSSSPDYDVSVLTLYRNSNKATAKIFVGESSLTNYQATIIGVGTLSEGGAVPNNLQSATIPIVTNNICRNSYGAVITDRMLCAGFIGGGRDSCQGDSGGPLWVTYEGKKVQAGITSFGSGCARPHFYGVYSRTSALDKFIRQYAPNAVFSGAKTNIIPILQLLLFDDDGVYEPPVCNHPINLGESVNVQFSTKCFDWTNSRYYKTYTFTIGQDAQVVITSPPSSNYWTDFRLYEGTDASGLVIDYDNSSAPGWQAILLNQLSAGTYTIEIINPRVDELAEFSLGVNNCQSSPITMNTNVQSSFESDCRRVAGNRHDYAAYYSFTLDQAQQITITSPQSTDLNASISLYSGTDVSGNAIDTGDSYHREAILVNHLSAGTYTIEITSSSVDELVEFSLGVNNCQSSPITMNTNVQSSFESDCRRVAGNRHDYAAYYSFTLDQAQQITITSPQSTDRNASISLYSGTDVSGNAIDTDDSYYYSEAILVNQLSAGTYTIEITSSSVDELVEFSLGVNNCQSSPITMNTNVQSSFENDCRSISINNGPYARYYSFTLDQAQQITITSPQSTDFRAYLGLYSGTDVSGNAIDTDGSYYSEAILVNQLSAGTYTIEITSSSVDELVEFSLGVNNCQSSPITMNTNVQSSFENDCRSISINNGPYARYYSFTLDQAQQITITSPPSTDIRAYVGLYSGTDVSGNAIETDRPYTSEAILVNQLSAGTYTIEITSSSVDELVEFSLGVNNCQSSPITMNTNVQSSFESDCRRVAGNRHDYAAYYSFTLDQAQQITITSPPTNDFIASISLYSGTDVSGNAIDTDYSYVSEAILVNQLSAGTYTIEITSPYIDRNTSINISDL